MVTFGHDFKKEYFPLVDHEVIPINHGSFGLTPAPVLKRQQQVVELQERYSDEFFFVTAPEEYKKQLKELGSYLNVNYRNIVLVANATTAVNTVLRSIPWDTTRDKILFHSTTYYACGNTVRFLTDYFKLPHDVVQLRYPLEDDEVLALFEEKLATGGYKLCLFDMISSMPGIKIPYERLISLCHKYNVWTLVDGAHAAGQVDLSFLDRLKPDFMTTNLHKWLFVPKSCAMLYINPEHHELIQPFPVSWSYGLKRFESPSTAEEVEHNEDLLINKFSFVGTVSYAQMLSVGEALKFRSEVCGGEESIREYQYGLQKKAVERVKDVFGPGSRLLQNSKNSLTVPGLFNVSLPVSKMFLPLIEYLQGDFASFKKFKSKCDKKMLENKAFAPFSFHNGNIWVRFSVNVYNEANDYTKGAASVKAVTEEFLAEELKIFGQKCLT